MDLKTKKIKKQGSVYTPEYIVNNVLDLADYKGKKILKKHVIDNSCGDGAFLKEIINRYCVEFLKNSNSKTQLKKELETYIHGIEIDIDEYSKCNIHLNDFMNKKYGIKNIEFNIINDSALNIDIFNNKMDYVLGNPPYVRIHNIFDLKNLKNSTFMQNGMSDLYLAFFELSIKMLSKNGCLSLITPSSWFTSIAGANMRNFLLSTNKLYSVCDLKHYQPFNAVTYTAITTIKNRINLNVKYYEYDQKTLSPFFLYEQPLDKFNIGGKFYFVSPKNIEILSKILSIKIDDNLINVKNGFATLADNVFIKDEFDFESPIKIKVYKASKNQWKECLFPYKDSQILEFTKEILGDKTIEYFEQNKQLLKNRSLSEKEKWYAFGRTQGIKDINMHKIAINTLLKNVNDIKIKNLSPGEGIYSGLYIITKINPKIIINFIKNEEFIQYIILLGKYKNGGYYTFSSSELKKYLIYKVKEFNYDE
ncbi:N-6 DNA methylase [Mycoplasmopsis cynos]|uniref:Eco57I restriction-modification methylase domain-containing protein n=1 Tax=Mycoplasmopsis cynos TaxID=171284 RepID=UPI002AFF4B38|nr:Eco57I restriction-modification methylase domain-containing protein [Mycoplasmopsis cynos]WQQ15551.1 N-6 DNA methylase [Mycoplasmopsis cynos]